MNRNTLDETHIPEVLRTTPQWVLWRREAREPKPTKVPYDVRTGRHARVNDPATWSTFDEAMTAYRANEQWSGIGFVFKKGGGFVGIDLDQCRNPETGCITADAQSILKRLDSYAELSPSGTGVHLIARGELPEGRRRIGTIEMYAEKRFFTMTGCHIAGMPLTVEERSHELAALHGDVFSSQQNWHGGLLSCNEPGKSDSNNYRMSNKEFICHFLASSDKARLLWGGIFTDYPSQSEADAALCVLLAQATNGDATQIDRFFRLSALCRPKWDEPRGEQTYGAKTIENAIQYWRRPLDRSTASIHQIEKRPQIITSYRQLAELGEEMIDLLLDPVRHLQLFNRGGQLVRLNVVNAIPELEGVGEDYLRGELSTWADFFRLEDKKPVPVSPRLDAVKYVRSKGLARFPAVENLVMSPFFRPDGELVFKPGYDPMSRTLYCPSSTLCLPNVPTTPSTEDLAKAVSLLQETFVDFLFDNESSRSNAIALLLTIPARLMIDGQIPLFEVTAPQARTGKTLLLRVIAAIAHGVELNLLPPCQSEEEWRKRISTLLREGRQLIVFDNIEDSLESAALAAAITSPRWTDRLLGKNEAISVPQNSVFVATGNNFRLKGDLAYRAVRIRLDARMPRPWQRVTFKHGDILQWTKNHRGELLWAACVAVRSWIAAGSPDVPVPMFGGFAAWARTLGGILHHCGFEGFLGNADEIHIGTNNEANEWEEFIEGWYQRIGTTRMTAGELVDMMDQGRSPFAELLPGTMADDLAGSTKGSSARRMGWALKRQRDRHFGDYCLKAEEGRNSCRWFVVRTRYSE